MELITNRKTFIGTLAISIAAIFWGLDGVVLTPQLYNLDVSFAVFLLHGIPFVLMNLFLYKRYKDITLLGKKELVAMFLVALLGGALGTISIVKALFLVNFKHLSVVILIQKLQPIFAILLAAIFLKEKITKNFLVFASLAVMASYLLVFEFSLPSIKGDATNIYAILLSLFAAISFGSSTVLSKIALEKLDFKTVTFFRYGITSFIMLIITICTGHFLDFSYVTPNNWLILFIIGITTGSGAIFLFYYGLIRVRAVVSIICELFFPLSAILFDYIINDYALSPIKWIAVCTMVLSILILNYNYTKN